MNIYLKALAAVAFSMVVAGSASAGVRIHILAGPPQPYHTHTYGQPYVVHEPYYGYREVVVEPSWEARRAWRLQREREWRRAQWERREARRHHH